MDRPGGPVYQKRVPPARVRGWNVTYDQLGPIAHEAFQRLTRHPLYVDGYLTRTARGRVLAPTETRRSLSTWVKAIESSR